jgi:hypothetical protein
VANINLTQEDADALLAMEKHRGDDIAYEYPSLGGGIRVPELARCGGIGRLPQVRP